MEKLTLNGKEKIVFEPYDKEKLKNLCGPCDINIKKIESTCKVEISKKENKFIILGEKENVKKVLLQLKNLYELAGSTVINSKEIHITKEKTKIQNLDNDTDSNLEQMNIRLYSKTQKDYIKNIYNNTINFSIGPSGTGKTYLAVAYGAKALLNKEVKRIILVRPAVDAGEKLGFLPGNCTEKVDPYLRPFYDALYEILSPEKTNHYIENGKIEIAPLAFMRGRTLSESFIILDEAQNTSIEQMKMLLTRLGHDTKMVITGDTTQVDLPQNQKSGLKHANQILQNIKQISFTHFTKKDVIRHNLIQSILEAYESHHI